MNLIQCISSKVAAYIEDVIRYRRHLHQHPELSFQEFETSRFIKEILAEHHIPFSEIGDTGVLAFIDSQDGCLDQVVVLRADMDALPIEELNDLPYRSQRSGVMHACGHDFHTANLLGVAIVLKQMQTDFSGRVLLIFQPAEERIPGGAKMILDSGVLNEYEGKIKAMLGLHVSPQLPAGHIGLCPGRFMASSDEFYVTVRGAGGHAAEPHRGVDPITVSAQLLSSLQQIVSRKADPAIPTVLTFGRFIGAGAVNVIPDEVTMEGILRTMDEAWRERAITLIERQIQQFPLLSDAEATLTIKRGYPYLYNHPELTAIVGSHLKEILGDEVVGETGIWMAAEDFAYYSHRYPSVFFLVGVQEESRYPYSLHNARFDVSESAFKPAMEGLVGATIRLLDNSTGTKQGGNNE